MRPTFVRLCLLASFSEPVAAAPAIQLQTTVGAASVYCIVPGDPNDCTLPPTDAAQIAPGEDVMVGFRATNSGDVNLTSHTLVDSALGTLLSNFPFTLTPGASVFLTQRFTAPLTPGTYPRGATWTAAASGGGNAAGNDAYAFTVTQPELLLDVTIAVATDVCPDPDVIETCALPLTDTVPFMPGVKLVIGYSVSNVGPVAFTRHELTDDALGPILVDFPFDLAPGSEVFLLQFTTPAAPFARDARWSGTTGGGFVFESADTYAALASQIFNDGFE